MRKFMKSTIISLLLILAMLFTGDHTVIAESTNSKVNNKESQPAEVDSKEEVIYAILDCNGGVNEIYAVNILNVLKAGLVTDYGDYESLKNLTNTEPLDYNKQLVTAVAEKGRFYYQGTLEESALPWKIQVSYLLDGKEITTEKLAGSNGNLDIHITTSSNESKNLTFYKNYLLQVSITLNTDLCKNIKAEGATIANAGKNQILSFTVMPNTDGNININTEVSAFEMESISFSAVPFSMNIEIPDTSDMSSKLTTLSDAIAQLNDGVSQLKGGISSLSNGSTSLKNGSADFLEGMNHLASSSKDLTKASQAILEALVYIDSNLKNSGGELDLASLEQLPAGLNQLSSGLGQISEGLKSLNTGYSEAYKALSSAIAGIPSESISEEELAKLMADNQNSKALNQLVENYKAAQTVKETYKLVSAAFEAVETNLPVFTSSIETMIESLKTIQSEMSEALKNSDITSSLTQLSLGISELKNNYRKFDTGLLQYTEGISKLNGAYTKVHKGIEGLTNGASELTKGIGDLAGGTSELYSKTKNMPKQMESTVEELLEEYENTDFTPVSFVSEENKNVRLVQFVFKTDKIEKVQVEPQVTTEKEKETFWTRLTNLF